MRGKKERRKKIPKVAGRGKKVKRAVIKVGSAVVAGLKGSVAGRRDARGARHEVFSPLAAGIKELTEAGIECVVVSSGAIAMGMEKLGMKERPASIPERQAVAAVGQSRLMAGYEDAFSKVGINVAQILLTHDDFSDRKRFANAKNALAEILNRGIVPVINENDTVAVEELKFGDNDKIAALVTNLVEADRLVILSDINGIYDMDPKVHDEAKRLSEIKDIDGFTAPEGATKSSLGSGGIASKVAAARIAAHFGCSTVITSGFDLDGLFDAASGASAKEAAKNSGTYVHPKADPLTGKKHWITYSTRPSGRIFVDDGARQALLEKGKSLLPSGVVKVEGGFEAGEVVHCVDGRGMEFARGVVNYGSEEIKKIRGVKTTEIEKTLGYKSYDEVIHRDNLVVI